LEEAVEPLGLAAEERAVMVQRFVQGLTVLEQTVDEA
jgi:hypothetical protein